MKSKTQRHRKPTGHIGSLVISAAGGAPRFDRIQLPDNKGEVESFILDLTLKALAREGVMPWPAVPVQNRENDFDFTLPGQPNEYLDLLEVAPLEGTRGGYSGALLEHNHGELADHVWTKLTGKAQAYGLPRPYGVHLLVYSTDLAFRLSTDVLKIVAYYLHASDRGFKSVYYSVPEADDAFVYCLQPRPATDFRRYDVRRARANRSLVADMARMTIEQRNGASVPVGGRRRPTKG